MNQWMGALNKFGRLSQSDTLMGILLNAAIAVVVALIVWLVIKTGLRLVKKRLSSLERVEIDGRLFLMVRKALGMGLILFLGTFLIRLFKIQMVEPLFHALFVIFIAMPVKGFMLIIFQYVEKMWADKTETKLDNVIFDLLIRFSGAIVYAVAVILALDIMGVNVMPFVAGAGVLGVAVGFAAKDTLSNLIAGILLIIDRPFEIGDRIEVWSAPVDSSSWGDVIDIGLRATKIKTTDNIVIVIPNNEIMKRDIVNYTQISSSIRVRINIGVAYDADIEHAKEVIVSVAESADWVQKDPAPKVVVRHLGESSVDLQLRVWITDARRRMDTISFVTDTVKAAFDKAGIEIPLPKRDIHLIWKSENKTPA